MSKMAGSLDIAAPVAAIEMSDINDGDVINGTGHEMGKDANVGKYRFVYNLPSGRLLNSEWLDPAGDQRQLRKLWLEAVKGQIVADAQGAQEESLRQRRAKQLIEVAEDVKVIEPSNTPIPMAHTAKSSLVATASDLGEDPAKVIKRHIIAATEASERADWEYNVASQNKKAADAALAKWTKLLELVK